MNIHKLMARTKPGRLCDYEMFKNWINLREFKQQMRLAEKDTLIRLDPVAPVQLLMNCDDELHWKDKATNFGNQIQVTMRNRAVTFALRDDGKPAAAIRETVAMQWLMDPELYVTDGVKLMLLTELDSYKVLTQYQMNTMNSYYMILF